MSLRLGCIADDFTGATDLANTLVRQGLRALQANGVPRGPLAGAADAVVVALKTRTAPAAEAVARSLEALHWLRAQGAQQIYFKVCSTFDSTPAGNIGPVAEALMQALATGFAVVTPAFPDTGRTVYQGHLFVGEQLLSESGMSRHPLTPMTDANLVRVLQAQCRQRVGLIAHGCVAQGAPAVRARIAALRDAGVALAIADAVDDADLLALGAALAGQPLLVGASGLALGLARQIGTAPHPEAAQLPPAHGAAAVLCGSCSEASRRQVGRFVESGAPALALDPRRIAAGDDVVAQALAWARPRLAQGPVLIHSAADVQGAQAALGADRAGALMEAALAAIALGLVEAGVRRLVLAGGETSGACVQALGVAQMRIGAQIDPGVPWCHAVCEAAPDGLHLALKSGNFGADDFFRRAFEVLR